MMTLSRILPLALVLGLAACQPAPAPKAEAPKVEAPSAQSDEPLGDDAAMPAAWQEADGPGAAQIFVESDGQRVALECSAKGSLAATSPGKVLASATWRAGENPPKSKDAALILEGAGFRGEPIWARENGRDAMFLQLEPTADLIGALKRGGDGLRLTAGDWFLAVAPDTKGIVTRFAQACETFTKIP